MMPLETNHPDRPNAESRPEDVRRMFGAITPAYDRLNRLFSGTLDRRWRRLAARAAVDGLEPCERLLDVATGTGDLAQALALRAKRAGGDPWVCGVDFTRPMLRQAACKYPGRRMAWVEGDGLSLPVASGNFDAAAIAFGLRNMQDPAAGLREMVRAVRPGGRVAVLEFGRPGNRLLRALYDWYGTWLMPRVGRLASGSQAYGYLARSIRTFWPAGELSRRMQEAGLERVRAIPLVFGIVYLHVGVKAGAHG